MKKTVTLLITFLLLTVGASAQQNNRYIQVLGNTTYQKNIQQYKVDIIMSLDYANGMYSTLEEIKEHYFKKLEKIGISQSQLKEDSYKYALLGYSGQGTAYRLKTSSKEIFEKFLFLKQTGVQVHTRFIDYSLDQKVAEITNKAIENARQKVEKIAEKMHKKIGKILVVNDSNNLNQINRNEALNYYDYINKYYYSVTVRFELLDK